MVTPFFSVLNLQKQKAYINPKTHFTQDTCSTV